MKSKLIFSAFFIFIAMSILALAVGDIDITSLPSTIVNPGETANFNVTVTNAGVGTISTVNLVSTALSGASTSISAPAITAITSLASGTPQIRSFSVSPGFVLAGTYTATLTASEAGDPSNNDTMSYDLTVNTISALDIVSFSTTSPLVFRGEQRDSLTRSISVKNIGSTDLTLTGNEFTFNAENFEDSDDDAITLSFTDIGLLSPGESKSSTLTADFSNKIDLDKYTGTITLTDTATTATDTFDLEINVQPEVCEDGIVKDGDVVDSSSAHLQMDIDDPDNGDEFAPGESIDIDVTVDNNDDNDMDVVVEAFLYNLDEDNEIERVKSDSKEINDDDDEDFSLELVIPLEDLDEDDEYVLFVKAYEDGDEDSNCNEDSVDIDIEREDHQVVFEDFDVLPSVVACSEPVSFTTKVLNIGSKNEDDVFIEIKQNELGLEDTSEPFDLDSDEDAVRRFTFTIPENTNEKSYTVEAVVNFDDGDERTSEFATLRVEGCFVEPDFLQGSLSLGELTLTKTQASLPVTVTNNANIAGSFEVQVLGIENWANPVNLRTVSLQAGQSTTVFFYPQLREDLPETISATVNLLSMGNIVDSKNVETTAGEDSGLSTITGGSVFDFDGGRAFWIVADIVLIVLAVFLIRALFVRKK